VNEWVVLDPTGQRAAVSGGAEVRVWDLDSGGLLATAGDFEGTASATAFTADGSRLIALDTPRAGPLSGRGGRVVVWDGRIGTLRNVPWPERPSIDLGFRLVAAGPGPATEAERNEAAALMKQAIAGLKAADWEVILLRGYDDLGFLEIGELLGLTESTAAAFCSSVLFQTARVVPGLPDLAAACAKRGAELLVDVYHHLNVVPFSLAGLEQAYVTGGGYKYRQLGEGACFLRLPRGCAVRPVTTGWFTEFDALAAPAAGQVGVGYGRGGMRFAGATFDPTSYYRAAAVFGFFRERGLRAYPGS
jgi:hypothetical protein